MRRRGTRSRTCPSTSHTRTNILATKKSTNITRNSMFRTPGSWTDLFWPWPSLRRKNLTGSEEILSLRMIGPFVPFQRKSMSYTTLPKTFFVRIILFSYQLPLARHTWCNFFYPSGPVGYPAGGVLWSCASTVHELRRPWRPDWTRNHTWFQQRDPKGRRSELRTGGKVYHWSVQQLQGWFFTCEREYMKRSYVSNIYIFVLSITQSTNCS